VGVHLISVPKVTVGFGCFHRAGAGNARIYKGFEVGISLQPISMRNQPLIGHHQVELRRRRIHSLDRRCDSAAGESERRAQSRHSSPKCPVPEPDPYLGIVVHVHFGLSLSRNARL
jgi:hypothetical protein